MESQWKERPAGITILQSSLLQRWAMSLAHNWISNQRLNLHSFAGQQYPNELCKAFADQIDFDRLAYPIFGVIQEYNVLLLWEWLPLSIFRQMYYNFSVVIVNFSLALGSERLCADICVSTATSATDKSWTSSWDPSVPRGLQPTYRRDSREGAQLAPQVGLTQLTCRALPPQPQLAAASRPSPDTKRHPRARGMNDHLFDTVVVAVTLLTATTIEIRSIRWDTTLQNCWTKKWRHLSKNWNIK